MKSTRNNAPEGSQVFFTRIKRVVALLWIMGACIVLLSGFRSPLWAQDLAVDWVTVTPSEGEAGDTVSLQAKIENNDPGMAIFISYRWYLSADAQISSAGIVLGEIITSNEYLYAGGSTIVLETIAPEPWKHLF